MRRLALLIALLAACAGCGGGHAKLLAVGQLSGVVLRPSDVPAWTRFQNDSGTAADVGALGSRDRLGAWIVRYRRASAVIVSRIDVYRTAAAAHDVLKAMGVQAAGNGVGTLATPALGDERVGYTVGTPASLDTIFWRRSNAIVSIVWQGVGVRDGAVVALATREDARVRSALR